DGEAAYADVTVSGDDITGLRLTASKRSVVSGRVLVDPAAAQTLRPASLRLGLQPVQFDMIMMGGTPPAVVNDDLSFEIKAAPGEYRVIALDYLDQNEWNTPEYLDGLRSKAVSFSVNEGETKSVDLRITNVS